MILAGRSINDSMAAWLADRLDAGLAPKSSVLVLGLTFKENVPDLRNSKVAELVALLAAKGHRLSVHDPLADPHEALHEYGIDLLSALPDERHDAVILAVPHAAYLALPEARLAALLEEGGLFADIKNAVPVLDGAVGLRRWRL